MNPNKLKILLAVVCSHTALAERHEQTSPAQTQLSLPDVLRAVVEQNPTLRAARAKWQAARERVPQEAAWDDLRVDVGQTLHRFPTVPRDSFMDTELMFEQSIPISGKNRSRARAADAESVAAFEEVRRIELDVLRRARVAFFSLADTGAQLEFNRRNQGLLVQSTDSSRAKYEVGTRRQADVLMAETEAAKNMELRADLVRQTVSLQSELNALMNRPAQTPLGPPPELRATAHKFSMVEAQRIAFAQRPEISMARAKLDAEKSRLELARRAWIPDPAVRVKLDRYNSSTNALSEIGAGISFTVPWSNERKYRAAIREAEQLVTRAERELEAARVEASALVRDQFNKIETYAHHSELYRDKILPLADQTFRATGTSYETDKATLLELLTAQRGLRDAQSAAVEHLMHHEAAVAELYAIIGHDPAAQTGRKK